MAYAASEANPEGDIIFFDKHSHIIAFAKPNTSRAPFLGGGTVNWEKLKGEQPVESPFRVMP